MKLHLNVFGRSRKIPEFCPTLEDIENLEIQKLVNRLKGESEKYTFTNILEWQHRNIRYWEERQALPWSLLFSIVLGSFVLLLSISYMKPFIKFSLVNDNLISFMKRALLVTILLLLLPIFSLKIYLIILYRHLFRELSLMRRETLALLNDTLKESLSVEKIIRYKSAVCRDYAKLTASILLNLYPEVYFVTIPFHVATCVKIGNRFYVLDKRLPIISLERWFVEWHHLLKLNKLKPWQKHDYTIYVAKVKKDSNRKPIDLIFEEYYKDKTNETNISISEKCIKKLSFELVKVFKLSQKTEKKEPDLEIELKNYAIYCEDDEIVQYSMLRALKNKIEAELCSNINKLTKIELVQKDRDLVLKLYLS